MRQGKERLRIAILGDRGIPARYGGFSTLVEEVSTSLVRDHGMNVTVYCRRHYYDERSAGYRGVRLVHLPAPGGKMFESLIHTSLSVLHACGQRFDAVLLLDPGNAPLVLPLRLRGFPVALHTDGLGWKRRKWSRLARAYYRWSEGLSARLTTRLVTDALAMRAHYREAYRTDSTFIPYGSRVGSPASDEGLARFGLEANGYYLVVARLEPDNNPDLIVREHQDSGVRRPLVLVGGDRYPTEYSRSLKAGHAETVRFVGPIYDSAVLNGLYENSYAYLHGHEVGGTNPALLRAMDAGRPCMALDVVFNREVLGEAGLFFSRAPGALARDIRELDTNPRRADEKGRQAKKRARAHYRWDAVADGYARLFRRLVEARRQGRSAPAVDLDSVYRPAEFSRSE